MEVGCVERLFKKSYVKFTKKTMEANKDPFSGLLKSSCQWIAVSTVFRSVVDHGKG